MSIEDLYDQSILGTTLSGKTFNKTNKKSSDTEYGKFYFLEYVVKKKNKDIDFSGFKPLLDRLRQCTLDWEENNNDSK